MKKSFFVSAALLLLLSCQSFAISGGGYETPADSAVIQSSGKATVKQLPRRFSLFNWNIEKAKQGDVWARDFAELIRNKDLVLVQEAISDDIFSNEMMIFSVGDRVVREIFLVELHSLFMMSVWHSISSACLSPLFVKIIEIYQA